MLKKVFSSPTKKSVIKELILKEIDDFTLYMIPIKINTEGAFIRAFGETK